MWRILHILSKKFRRQRFNFPHIYCECTKLITFILKDTWHTTCFLQELTVSYNLTSVPVCYLLTWQLIWKITKCRYTSMPKWDNYKSVSLLILAVTPRSCTSAVCTVALITTAGRRQNLYFGRLRYLSGKWPRGRGDPGEKSWSRTKLYISALLLWLLLTRKFCKNWMDIRNTQEGKIKKYLLLMPKKMWWSRHSLGLGAELLCHWSLIPAAFPEHCS